VAASSKVKDLINTKRYLFLPPLNKNRRQKFNLPVFSPPAKFDIKVLPAQFLKILAEFNKQQEIKLEEKVIVPKISIDDKIFNIKKMLVQRASISFSKLLAVATSKTEVIVNFLAVLELAKQRELFFEQEELFSEIRISRQQ
jgi:segregation and condensation protein A